VDFNISAELPTSLAQIEEKDGVVIEPIPIQTEGEVEKEVEKLIPSMEYKNLLLNLSNPKDLLRVVYPHIDQHPETTGGTHIGNRDTPRRIDYIFHYEDGIGEISKENFLNFGILKMKQFVVRPKELPEYDVTDHKAISLLLEINGTNIVNSNNNNTNENININNDNYNTNEKEEIEKNDESDDSINNEIDKDNDMKDNNENYKGITLNDSN